MICYRENVCNFYYRKLLNKIKFILIIQISENYIRQKTNENLVNLSEKSSSKYSAISMIPQITLYRDLNPF